MTFLARSLALATTLALLPGTALANPATLATLQTVAVADDAGVAQALVQPGTTKVTVVVDTAAPVAAPACEVTPPIHAPQPYYERIRKDRKTGRGLLIGGAALGGLAYLYTSLAGALAIDKARGLATDDPGTPGNEGRARAERRAYGRALLVPGIGPALAIPRADTAIRAWGAGIAGVTQAVAIGMTIVGLYHLGRAHRLERLSLGAMAGAQQAHVSLAVRF